MRNAIDFIKFDIIDRQIKMKNLKKFNDTSINVFINDFMHFADSTNDAIDDFENIFDHHFYFLNFLNLIDHFGHAMSHTKMLYS